MTTTKTKRKKTVGGLTPDELKAVKRRALKEGLGKIAGGVRRLESVSYDVAERFLIPFYNDRTGKNTLIIFCRMFLGFSTEVYDLRPLNR